MVERSANDARASVWRAVTIAVAGVLDEHGEHRHRCRPTEDGRRQDVKKTETRTQHCDDVGRHQYAGRTDRTNRCSKQTHRTSHPPTTTSL